MPKPEPLQIGVVFWTGGELGDQGTPDEIASLVGSLGIRCGQLGLHGKADLGPEERRRWKEALQRHQIAVVTVFPAFEGESYADYPTVKRTVGFVPREYRKERERRTLEASDFARELGIPGVATHIGFVPEDHSDPDFVAVRDMVRRVCDHCAGNDQTFGLETGQEPAPVLKEFILAVDRPNLRVNFDPANMIMYGAGDPLEAVDVLKEWIVTVHCKDGIWPDRPGTLGREKPLGQGDVNLGRFVAKLKEIGYTGPLVIEREITGEEQKADIREAVALLERLRGA